MSNRTIGAAAFKAQCLSLIDEVNATGDTLTITKRGKPVAVVSAVKTQQRTSLIGAMKGTVLRFDDPFSPACDPDEWEANR